MVDQEQITENKKQIEANKNEKESIVEAKAKLEKPEIKTEDTKSETPEGTTPKKTESKETKEETKKPKKPEPVKGPKKTEALVTGRSLHISTKHSIAICNFIKGKNIEKAIAELEDAEKMKFAIPMRGEIPHKKGIMSGRFPVKAIGEFIKLLKSLKSNAIANELELEKVFISCKSNIASRPYRRFGRKRFKRTHVEIKLAKRIKKKSKKAKENKK